MIIDTMVHLKVSEHVCGTDYCLIDVSGTEPAHNHTTSFTFSLEYLFDYVLEKDRIWFIQQVAAQYLNIEVLRVYKQKQNMNYIMTNINEALAKCEEIRQKVIDAPV